MGQIKAPVGANTKKTIIGRGKSSKGRSSGRGHDGQNSRSGGGVRPGFEGGQMPIYRRLARKGFSNFPFKREYTAVSLGEIAKHFADGDEVTPEALKEKRIIKGKHTVAKILGDGDIDKKVTVKGLKTSSSAAEKITAAGGEVL
ncbi:MAG: 50S ribosomal protein L15 [Spirochaetota bacterium]